MKLNWLRIVFYVLIGIFVAVFGFRLIAGYFPFGGEFWVKVSNNALIGIFAMIPFLLLIGAGWIIWLRGLFHKK